MSLSVCRACGVAGKVLETDGRDKGQTGGQTDRRCAGSLAMLGVIGRAVLGCFAFVQVLVLVFLFLVWVSFVVCQIALASRASGVVWPADVSGQV